MMLTFSFSFCYQSELYRVLYVIFQGRRIRKNPTRRYLHFTSSPSKEHSDSKLDCRGGDRVQTIPKVATGNRAGATSRDELFLAQDENSGASRRSKGTIGVADRKNGIALFSA